MRLLAIDYGEKRVGVASTDETGSFALPRAVLPNDEALLYKILELKEALKTEKIIIGESRDFKGRPNPILSEIQKFKAELEKGGAEVIYHTEVFTTVEARRLQGQTPMTDASAAALILKSYIESNQPR